MALEHVRRDKRCERDVEKRNKKSGRRIEKSEVVARLGTLGSGVVEGMQSLCAA